MPKIPAGEVVIRRVYIIDCNVCQEAVEADYAVEDRRTAQELKDEHLKWHAQDAGG